MKRTRTQASKLAKRRNRKDWAIRKMQSHGHWCPPSEPKFHISSGTGAIWLTIKRKRPESYLYVPVGLARQYYVAMIWGERVFRLAEAFVNSCFFSSKGQPSIWLFYMHIRKRTRRWLYIISMADDDLHDDFWLPRDLAWSIVMHGLNSQQSFRGALGGSLQHQDTII